MKKTGTSNTSNPTRRSSSSGWGGANRTVGSTAGSSGTLPDLPATNGSTGPGTSDGRPERPSTPVPGDQWGHQQEPSPNNRDTTNKVTIAQIINTQLFDIFKIILHPSIFQTSYIFPSFHLFLVKMMWTGNYSIFGWKRGERLVEIPADGLCFLRALQHCLSVQHNEIYSLQEMKNKILEEITNKSKQYMPFHTAKKPTGDASTK